MTHHQAIQLYNTYTRRLETLTSIVPGEVGIYCCGPTVYNFQHIGNFKTFIFEDLLVRTLRQAGLKVRHVMNITDVGHLTSNSDTGEDKMILAMKREGKSSTEIADFYTNKFLEDWDRLNLRRPDVICKATEHIFEMIELIKRIEASGYAYFSNGNVYFDVEKFENYGKLALLDLSKLRAGARVHIDSHKKSPFDFVLWFTKSKFEDQELQWDSPWGRGYPGWHIECSAMAMKYLGEEIDIHCGGIDHIPVHHTNEIAQAEAATGKPWVRIWMHSQFMLIDDSKMSKSTGKFLVLDDLVASGLGPLDFRFFVLTAHYRSQLNFSWTALENASRSLTKLRAAIREVVESAKAGPNETVNSPLAGEYLSRFQHAMYSDLNTPQALAVLWEVVSCKKLSPHEKVELIEAIDAIFNLDLSRLEAEKVDLPHEIQAIVAKREEARKNNNWSESDKMRDELLSLGFVVKDFKDGPPVVRRK